MSKPSASEADYGSDEDSAEVIAGGVVDSFNLVEGSTSVSDVLNAAENSPSLMSRQRRSVNQFSHTNEASIDMDSAHSDSRYQNYEQRMEQRFTEMHNTLL